MSPRWMPPLYALLGLVVLVTATAINHYLAHEAAAVPHAVAPAITGLLLGWWLGHYRQKWLEKERALDEAGRELESRLQETRNQRQLTHHLQGLLDHTPLPIFLKNRDHRYILVNAPFERIVGKGADAIIGQTDHDIFPDPVADIFQEQDELVLREQKRRTFEETLPLAQGVMTFHSFKFPLHDETGEVYALGGVSIDISLLKAAQDETTRERRKLKAVIEAIDQGVILTRPDGRITLASTLAADLLGERPASLVDRDIHEFALPGPHRSIPLVDRFGQEMGHLVVLGGGEEDAGAERAGTGGETAGASQEETTPVADKGTILVMDDDSLVRRTSRMMLARLGFTVVDCSHGQAAVDAYRRLLNEGQPPQAVIMDLTVPGGMGGVEATESILALDPEARIMVASGYSKDPVLANYLDYGFLARVEKPFSSQKLKEALHQILED